MRHCQIAAVVLTLLTIGSSPAACQQSAVNPVAESHIQANVPEGKDFNVFLKRDLASYFKEVMGKDVSVEYELLREGPTQAGVALPKFYAWVTIKEKSKVIEEGAVRLAAVERKQFEITNYLKRAEIERDIGQVYEVFPRPVGDKIKGKVGK